MAKKRILSAFLALLLVLTCCMGFVTEVSAASTKKSGGFLYCYSESYQGIELLEYTKKKAEAVNVPAEIDGTPVKVIGEDCFDRCRKLKSIKLPSQLMIIGEFAFSGCESLTKLTIPASVTVIEDFAFASCEELKKITIPRNSNLKRIGSQAFEYCKKLKTITLPASIETLEPCAFASSYFKKISFAKDAKIKKIPEHCFSDCPNLEEIDIPQNVTAIGKEIFLFYRHEEYYSDKVMKINIMGGKIKKLGKNALKGLNPKATIAVPEKYKTKYKKLFKKQSWYQSTMKIR